MNTIDPALASAVARDLQTDEGVRLKPYMDTVGKWTIGIGRNLSDMGISMAEALVLLNNDIDRAVADLDQHWLWWRRLPTMKAAVMINLCFNMGASRLAEFTHFLAAMQASDWTRAAQELVASDWYAEVGTRGPRMISRLIEFG